MKYLKTFEKINKKPYFQIGDIVYCKEFSPRSSYQSEREIYNFLKNNAGEIIAVNDSNFDYIIKFYNIPMKIKQYFSDYGKPDCRAFFKNEIKKKITNPQEIREFLIKKDASIYNL